jgi:hypothetical protein
MSDGQRVTELMKYTLARNFDTIVDTNGLAVVDVFPRALAEAGVIKVLKVGHDSQ